MRRAALISPLLAAALLAACAPGNPKSTEAAASPSPAASALPAPVEPVAFHAGFDKALPKGGLYDGKSLTHKVQPGDSVEAIAYHYYRFTDAYTYPELANRIRKLNGGERALTIGETLKIPGVRQAPPRPALVPVPKTFDAKGVYVTGTTAGSNEVWKLVKALKAQGGNTVVFDAKDMSGVMSYDSQVPLAKSVGAYQGGMITDLPKFVERMHAEGIHLAARLTCFHDARLVSRKPQLALRSKRSGGAWLENGRLVWADASLSEVQDYNLAIAKELIGSGVDEIQFDYVRFPAMADTADIAWSTMKTEPEKRMVITRWVKRAYEAIHPTGALLSADVYGVVAWDKGIDVKITGQHLPEMGQYLDVLSPMLYPSHFYPPFDGHSYPAWEPYYFLNEGVKRSMKKTEGTGVVIRPWVQAFPFMVKSHYNPGYVAEQLKGSRDAGATGWLLWNAENDYKVGLAGVAIDAQAAAAAPKVAAVAGSSAAPAGSEPSSASSSPSPAGSVPSPASASPAPAGRAPSPASASLAPASPPSP